MILTLLLTAAGFIIIFSAVKDYTSTVSAMHFLVRQIIAGFCSKFIASLLGNHNETMPTRFLRKVLKVLCHRLRSITEQIGQTSDLVVRRPFRVEYPQMEYVVYSEP